MRAAEARRHAVALDELAVHRLHQFCHPALVLVADAQAFHQSVVTAMEAIGQAGFANMSIATQRLADEQ